MTNQHFLNAAASIFIFYSLVPGAALASDCDISIENFDAGGTRITKSQIKDLVRFNMVWRTRKLKKPGYQLLIPGAGEGSCNFFQSTRFANKVRHWIRTSGVLKLKGEAAKSSKNQADRYSAVKDILSKLSLSSHVSYVVDEFPLKSYTWDRLLEFVSKENQRNEPSKLDFQVVVKCNCSIALKRCESLKANEKTQLKLFNEHEARAKTLFEKSKLERQKYTKLGSELKNLDNKAKRGKLRGASYKRYQQSRTEIGAKLMRAMGRFEALHEQHEETLKRLDNLRKQSRLGFLACRGLI